MSRGLTIAVLKSGGTKPEASEVLMMLVIVGRRTSRFSYSNFLQEWDQARMIWGQSSVEFLKQIVQ